MRFLFKLAFSIVAVVSLGLAAILYFAIDSAPSINRAADITPSSIERAKRILDQNDPRRLKPGARRTILVGASDLDLAANYLARQYADGGAQVELERGAARVVASLRVPALPFPAYLNFRAKLTEAAPLARIDSLRLGGLVIPGRLAQWMIPRLLRIAVPEADLRAFASVIRKVTIREDRIALTYTWQPDLPGKVRAVLLPPEDRERLRAYQDRLAAIGNSLAANPSLVEFLTPLFTLASERSEGGDAVAENRAVILLLAVYVNGRDISTVVPEAGAWPRPRKHRVLLNGRADLAKHFIVSSALAAKAGGPLSDAVGLYKELADARDGSGFSFNDLAADRAGTRFGERAADSPTARPLQRRLRAGIAERDIIPITEDLPEFMPEREFVSRFGGVDAPAYHELMAEIERRIAALPLYR